MQDWSSKASDAVWNPSPEQGFAYTSLAGAQKLGHPEPWPEQGFAYTGGRIMPITLKGSCRCGAVHFSVESHAPVPYQLCYCSICRKTAGGGGFAINLSADAATLKVEGEEAVGTFSAEIRDNDGHCERSQAQRRFCSHCGTALWLFDPRWPDLLHPFASAIDSHLPRAPEKTHIMLSFKASWVEPVIGPNDQSFAEYPEESIEDWHRKRGLWID